MKDESLRSVRVTLDNATLFYDYIKDNYAEYLFFRVDYAQYPENTEIFMVLDNKNAIQGMVLNWEDQRVQLRGSISSLEFLLKDKNYTPISVTGFDQHKRLIEKFFPEYKKEIVLYRMGLKKNNQKDFEKYPYIILTEIHREEIVSLMRIADPLFWGSRNPEDIIIDDNNIWYGIREQGKLICITNLWKYQNIGYITIVGTHRDNWNKGYASSLISSTLKELFKDKEQCFIMVRVENAPAVHTYTKLGFSICNMHFSYERL